MWVVEFCLFVVFYYRACTDSVRRIPRFVHGCLLVVGGLLALVVRVLERLSEVLETLTMITNE